MSAREIPCSSAITQLIMVIGGGGGAILTCNHRENHPCMAVLLCDNKLWLMCGVCTNHIFYNCRFYSMVIGLLEVTGNCFQCVFCISVFLILQLIHSN